jgi:ssDNA-binding Zn-finger/Zn-ribbon topoisomerase 1
MREKQPPIYRVKGTERDRIRKQANTKYPEGGWTPQLKKDRGELVIECPDCGTTLVHDVTAEAWERWAPVPCPSCRGVFTGREYPFTERVK